MVSIRGSMTAFLVKKFLGFRVQCFGFGVFCLGFGVRGF